MNRKAMSITAIVGKRNLCSFFCTFLFTNLFFIFFFLPSFYTFAEMPSMSMPTISGPSMPTLSTTSTSTTDSTSKSSTTSSTSSNPSQSSTSSTSSAITKAAATSAALQNLTASDISSLTGTSSLSSLGSLFGLGDTTSSSSLSSVSSLTTSTATNTLLQQILQQLSILVEKQQSTNNTSSITGTGNTATVGTSSTGAESSTNAVSNTTSVSGTTTVSSTTIASGTTTVPSANIDKSLPQLLRLRANGYNLLDTCSTIYFSKPEKNGTFLLTGDRKYLSGSIYRNETFYLLFVPVSTSSDQQMKYEVATSVIQDQVNEYSFLYQAASHSPLTASKTGNLITLYLSDKAYSFEILIQLGDTQ